MSNVLHSFTAPQTIGQIALICAIVVFVINNRLGHCIKLAEKHRLNIYSVLCAIGVTMVYIAVGYQVVTAPEFSLGLLGEALLLIVILELCMGLLMIIPAGLLKESRK